MTTAPAAPRLAAADMALRLTTPFARGADQLHLVVRGQTIEKYDFTLHQAQFGVEPRPLYVLQARKEVPPGTTVTFTVHGGPAVEVSLPEGMVPGTSADVPPPRGLLIGITSTLTGDQADWWQVTALLGTMAKLLWAVGWERDHLRHQMARTVAQRSVRTARKHSLDLHGAGLTVARSPGESDEAYRRRVALARRWTLPTPAGLAAALNAAVGPIGGHTAPLVVDDTNGALRRGLLALRVVPVELLPGQSIDAEGRTGSGPALPLPEGYFDPYFLVAVDTTRLDVAPPPDVTLPAGTPRPDPGRVQPSVAAALVRLAGLLTGRARVISGFDPTAGDARATGRAVLLTHPTTPSGRLAALAHRAGFDVVTHRTDGRVYAECAPGELLTVNAGTGTVTEGQQLALTVAPAPPPGARVRWYVVRCGAGRGEIGGTGEGAAAVFTGQAPGRVVVTAELRFGPHTLTASRELTVHPLPLADGTAIGADGTRDPAAPPPGTPLDPVFFARHDDPAHVEYGTDPNRHLMRHEVAVRLRALVVLLGGTTGKLVVQSAFEPTGTALAKEGRALRLTHPGVAPGALAVLAHRAGFTYVRVSGGVVTAAQAEEQPVGVTATGLSDGVLEVGATARLTVVPAESVVGTLGVLTWSTGDGAASLVTTAPGEMSVRGVRPGPAWVQAAYRLGVRPYGAYQVAVRLRPELSGHVLQPAQRELIMNLLDGLHPLGVEVVTRELTGGSP